MTDVPNKITEKEYPDLWENLTDDFDSLGEMTHRRGSTFYVNPRYTISDSQAPSNPELWGTWEAETMTWCDDWGLDDGPDTLYRVELKEKIVTTKEWVRV